MNSELLIKWIDLMFPALLNFCDVKGIVWDSIRAHLAKDLKATCISKKIDMIIIPGRSNAVPAGRGHRNIEVV